MLEFQGDCAFATVFISGWIFFTVVLGVMSLIVKENSQGTIIVSFEVFTYAVAINRQGSCERKMSVGLKGLEPKHITLVG